MKFSSKKNIETEEVHRDSNKFNYAIKTSNYDGKHENIYNLLRPKTGTSDSSLSIIICIMAIYLFL